VPSLLSLYSLLDDDAGGGPTVDVSVITDHYRFRVSGTCQCNVKLDNDGDHYESTNTGTYGASEGTFRTSGAGNEVFVERSIDSGTLTTDGLAGGRASCAADRILGVSRSTTGSKICTLTLSFYDASSGGNLLGTKQITVEAERG
jgi:hypothetical protein